MKAYYRLVTKYPKLIISLVCILSVLLSSQLENLRWETDARVYMPKGHPAIEYDEKIERLFGAKDSIIIIVENHDKTIYNPKTLETVERITEKVASLPGVIATRELDVASLTTITLFEGDETRLGANKLIEKIPENEFEFDLLKERILQHQDILVGNLVSADGTAAMIRARLKEGLSNRYQTYWQIKGIVAAESGQGQDWGGWGANDWSSGQWANDAGSAEDDNTEDSSKNNWSQWQTEIPQEIKEENGDKFHIAGRPAIEVTSGLNALDDIKVMIPLLIAVMAATLFLVFRTGRGVVLPMLVMVGSIIWTLGIMAFLDVPMYTISTMLPVVLVAIGIGDSIHFLSGYYNKVLENPHRPGCEIVSEVLGELNGPLITTSLTTGIGFLALLFAEMPPFKVFGLFTVLGIGISWLLTVTFMSAILSIMKPRVAGYLDRKKSLRLYDGQDALSRVLVKFSNLLLSRPKQVSIITITVLIVLGIGVGQLYVNSSWMSDFKNDSEVIRATKLLNEKFDGSITLNIVLEADRKDAFKTPEVLKKMEDLQKYAENLKLVGDTLSITDYLKSLNKTLHAMDPGYYRIPESKEQISEGLYLYSVSGQPELLDEMIDYGYQNANIVVMIQTDETMRLREIIDSIDEYAVEAFEGMGIDINYAGSGNNSYIWADLLINSQATALLFSKVAIFLMAILLLKSVYGGVAIVLPVIVSTIIVAGLAGWFGVPMDVSTALAAGIAIGVGVDYAVHYVFRYRDLKKSGQAHEVAVLNTMKSVGRTIVFNALVVSAGFSILLLSQFPPHAKLGAFVVVYMAVSCLSAMIVLPVILKRYAGG